MNLPDNHQKRRLGLTLGGGGARGIAHIAFLKVLDELNIRPAVISGTSIGALIGSLYASGQSGRDIERIIKEKNILDLISLVDFKWFHANDGLIRGDTIAKTLSTLTLNQRFEDLYIPLRIIATDFRKQTEVVLKEGDLIEAVRASISLPGIFEPVIKDNRVLIDGGIINSLPYECIRDECDVLVAINVFGDKIPESETPTKPKIFEAIFMAFHIMESATLELKLSRSRPDVYYKPKLANIELLGFHQIDEIFADVQTEAEQLKQYLQNNIQHFR
ncbi:MAG: patatin-like phospholipase family protein [Candidatus Omnitrophica bacterium]|nr:patatin-like phospholipase family protein [Candidatus Omnitrophota bacterium]